MSDVKSVESGIMVMPSKPRTAPTANAQVVAQPTSAVTRCQDNASARRMSRESDAPNASRIPGITRPAWAVTTASVDLLQRACNAIKKQDSASVAMVSWAGSVIGVNLDIIATVLKAAKNVNAATEATAM